LPSAVYRAAKQWRRPKDTFLIEAVSNHSAMLGVLATSFFGGVGLGLRFRVLILLPVVIACILVICAVGSAFRIGLWPGAIAIAINAFGLQTGYLVGACISFALRPNGNGAPRQPAPPTFLSFFERSAPLRRMGRPSSDNS
jgi:hypothetical protein